MIGTPSPDAEGRFAQAAPHGADCSTVRLRPDLHFCRIGARFIFLDLAVDRYFMLEGSAAERFDLWCNETADAADILWLQDLGLVEPGTAHPARSCPTPPRLSLYDAPSARARPWLVAEALYEQAIACRRVRVEPLAVLLRQGASGSANLEACRPIAAACLAAARYRKATDQCLPNALAMRRMLARRGIASDVVIGAALPFSAHCWLQSGETVLSDPLDSVQNFRPLIAA